MREPLPPRVVAALDRAEAAGFELSSEPGVGALLAALAASVPENGRILELGTGAGVGTAWLVEGLGDRTDVEVVTVDLDPGIQARARAGEWPACVCFELGDGAEAVSRLGRFDLIFPDAPGGKTVELRRTIAALRPGGILLVDDMDLSRHDDPELREAIASVRGRLFAAPDLVCAELPFASGVVVAAKRRS